MLTHIGSISYDQIMKNTPNLRAFADDDWLTEYVRSNDPYTVLETCFYDDALKSIATEQGIAENTDDIVGEILYKLGYKKKIKPTGLSQHLQNIKQLQNDDTEMTRVVEELLRQLFLFYTYILRWEALTEPDINGATPDVFDAYEEENISNSKKKKDPSDAIENLVKKHRNKVSRSLGDFYIWLKDLMEVVRNNVKLSNYCQKHFQCAVPLNKSQIAEISMFRTYRNLISSGHSIATDNWKRHKSRSETALGDMDDTTRKEWKSSWNNVMSVYERSQNLPKDQMLLRMASFF